MAMTDAEKESVIRWDKENDTAVVYTHDVALINKLKRLGAEPIDEGKFEGTPHATFELTKAWIKVGKPRTRNDLRGKAVGAKPRRKEVK